MGSVGTVWHRLLFYVQIMNIRATSSRPVKYSDKPVSLLLMNAFIAYNAKLVLRCSSVQTFD